MSEIYEPTPGAWRYVEGESAFAGDMQEPPTEAFPPQIVADTDRGEVVIATLAEPIPEEAVVDPDTG